MMPLKAHKVGVAPLEDAIARAIALSFLYDGEADASVYDAMPEELRVGISRCVLSIAGRQSSRDHLLNATMS